MSKAHPPELKKIMDKKLSLKLNGGRHVHGILRGFYPFMNIVLDDAVEVNKDDTKNNIGMEVLRGNSIIMLDSRIDSNTIPSDIIFKIKFCVM